MGESIRIDSLNQMDNCRFGKTSGYRLLTNI